MNNRSQAALSAHSPSMPEGWIELEKIDQFRGYLFVRAACRWAQQLAQQQMDQDMQQQYALLSDPQTVLKLLPIFEHTLQHEPTNPNGIRILKFLAGCNAGSQPINWPPADPHQITKALERLVRNYLVANAVSRTVKPLSVKGTATLMLRYVNLVLSLGNEQGWWRIPLITDVAYVPYPENPLSKAADKGYLRFVNQVVSTFIERIKRHTDLGSLPMDVRMGVVTWSLMTDSLINHPATLLKVSQKLYSLPDIGFVGGRLTVSLRDNSKLPERLFILSPITASLVIRARLWNLTPPRDKKVLQAALRAFLDWLEIRPVFYGLRAWCQAAQVASLGKVPTLMLSHRNGQVLGFAPYSESLSRLIPHAGPFGVSSETLTALRPGAAYPRTHAEDIRWVRQLLDFKSKSATKVLPRLQRALDNAPPLRPIIAALLEWCVETITPDGQRIRRSPYQMLTRFDSIARHLALALDENDIRDLSMQERARIYEAVKERAVSAGNLGRIAASLHAFEKWLVHKQYVEDTGLANDEELFAERQDRHIGVNAHLLSVDDYLKARDALIDLGQSRQLAPASREQATLAALMLVMGFRLGLRWAEAVGVRHMDVPLDCHTGQPCTLIIRPHDQRTLKTLNARRTLPISSLLDDTELALIRSQLKRPGAKTQSFLISRKKDMNTPLDTPMLRAMVVKAVRTSAGNEYLRFHHLRHSFANWLMLSLGVSQWRLDFRHVFAHLPKTIQWLADSDKRFAAISPVAVNDNHGGFLLTQLIGHGSLGTTLYHYVHVMDLLIGIYLEQRYAPHYGPKNLTVLMNVPESVFNASFYKTDKKPRWGVICLKHLLEKNRHDGGIRILLDRQKASRKGQSARHVEIAPALTPTLLDPWKKSKLAGAEWLVAIPILLEHGNPAQALPEVNAMLGQRLKLPKIDKLWTLLQKYPCLSLPPLSPEQWEELAELAKEFQKRVRKKLGLNYPVFIHDQARRSKSVDQLIEKTISTCRPLRTSDQPRIIPIEKLIWKFSEKSIEDAKEVIQLLQLASNTVNLKITCSKGCSRYKERKIKQIWRKKLGLSPKAYIGTDYTSKLKEGKYIFISPSGCCLDNRRSHKLNNLILYLIGAMYLSKI